MRDAHELLDVFDACLVLQVAPGTQHVEIPPPVEKREHAPTETLTLSPRSNPQMEPTALNVMAGHT